jgi:phage terminase small subunit
MSKRKTIKQLNNNPPQPTKPGDKPKLTNKQQIFIAEYLVDMDAKNAAIRAGYSKKSAYYIGFENLNKPIIKAEIDRQIEERKAKLSVTAESVINELALIGFANMADFIVIDEGGAIQAIPLDQLAKGKSRIIKKVKEKRVIRTVKGTKDKPDGEEILDATYEFELCDKVKSLELLSRHLGLLNDKNEVGLNAATAALILSMLPPEYADAIKRKLAEKKQK